MERRIACRAVLSVELADELVETGLVGHMRARELQYPLTPEGMLERLFADGAFAAHEGPLPSISSPVRIHDACYCCSRGTGSALCRPD